MISKPSPARVLPRAVATSAVEAPHVDALWRPPAAAPTPKRVALDAPAESEREVDDAPAPASCRIRLSDWAKELVAIGVRWANAFFEWQIISYIRHKTN
jgi:hypothetical protein